MHEDLHEKQSDQWKTQYAVSLILMGMFSSTGFSGSLQTQIRFLHKSGQKPDTQNNLKAMGGCFIIHYYYNYSLFCFPFFVCYFNSFNFFNFLFSSLQL